jgi:ubiquitin-protein ligase
MDKQRILREAQKIAAKFPFWMVSGNIEHLYGYAYESQGKKYELEIKFKEDFPEKPPKIVFHNDIKDLLGNFSINTLKNWTTDSQVVEIVSEIRDKIQKTLGAPKELEKSEKAMEPVHNAVKVVDQQPTNEIKTEDEKNVEYITPDLDAYPPDFDYESYITPDDALKADNTEGTNESIPPPVENSVPENETLPSDVNLFIDENEIPLTLSTELGLIQ